MGATHPRPKHVLPRQLIISNDPFFAMADKKKSFFCIILVKYVSKFIPGPNPVKRTYQGNVFFNITMIS